MIIDKNMLNQNRYKAVREKDKVEDIKQLDIKHLRKNSCYTIIKKNDLVVAKQSKMSLKELLS